MTVSDEQIRKVWTDQALTRKAAAERLGLTINVLAKRARNLGLPMREPVHLRNDRLRVTDEQVREIWSRTDLSRAEQAQRVGISVCSLQERANKLNLPMRQNVPDRRISASRIREVWLDPHLTTGEAANEVGLSRSNLWIRAKSMGLPPRKLGTRFALNDQREKRLFTAMWECHVRASEIAEHFDIHPQTVSTYARRFGLSKRTRPSLLISLDQFWHRWGEVRLGVELRRSAEESAARTRREYALRGAQ